MGLVWKSRHPEEGASESYYIESVSGYYTILVHDTGIAVLYIYGVPIPSVYDSVELAKGAASKYSERAGV